LYDKFNVPHSFSVSLAVFEIVRQKRMITSEIVICVYLLTCSTFNILFVRIAIHYATLRNGMSCRLDAENRVGSNETSNMD
jgi:hypothetical protein